MATRRQLETWLRDTTMLLREKLAAHELLTYASAIAFQVAKSLVPLVLLGLAVLGAVGRRDVWSDHIAPALKPRFDEPIYHAVDFGANKIFDSNSPGLLVLSSLLTVWYVSSGVRGIMSAINRIYETEETRPSWLRWMVSIGLAVCVVAGIIGAILLVLAVPMPNGGWKIPVGLVRWVGAIAAVTIATGLLVRLAPTKRRPKRWASAGAVLVIATWLLTSIVFRWYVTSIANFKSAVGQLTVLIVLLVYVYASSIVLLLGVEVDELLREDVRSEEHGLLHHLFGVGS